jgi:NifB/MoaA-like Fe-S oxidoreductase
MHVQVVLCPERNDGQVLRETVEHLAAVNTIEDVGVVPVSLTTEDPLRRVGATDAEAAVELIETLQPGLRAQIGRSFVHAADEMYLLAGRRPPAADAPLQYENGIGIAATFLEEAHTLASASNEWTDLSPLRLLCGTLARPVVEEACRLLGRSRPFPVENRLFGSHVTVAGLLSGADVLRALEEQPLRESEYLLAPRSFLPAALERTIDDVTVVTLREACHSRLVLGDGLGDAFARLPGS